jgi:hypothetical protein
MLITAPPFASLIAAARAEKSAEPCDAHHMASQARSADFRPTMDMNSPDSTHRLAPPAVAGRAMSRVWVIACSLVLDFFPQKSFS